jgi:hypothetical protein
MLMAKYSAQRRQLLTLGMANRRVVTSNGTMPVLPDVPLKIVFEYVTMQRWAALQATRGLIDTVTVDTDDEWFLPLEMHDLDAGFGIKIVRLPDAGPIDDDGSDDELNYEEVFTHVTLSVLMVSKQ